MYPYMASFLRIRDKDGSCVEVFNGCRTLANYDKPGRASGRWDLETSGTWEGCCLDFCNDPELADPDVNTDPWYVAGDPATEEVAGFLIDPPDGDGHGFYIEPSGATDIVDSESFEPLEMYITGTIVSCTSRGERAFLRWVDSVFRRCGCDPFKFEAYTGDWCPDDFAAIHIEDCGTKAYPPESFPVEPERPEKICCDANKLLPLTDEPTPYHLDTGYRCLSRVKYLGFEQLDEGLDGCAGNRYKFNFEVYDHCWNGLGVAVRAVEPYQWENCVCVCTNRYSICQATDSECCAELPSQEISGVTETSVTRRRAATSSRDTRGGLIARPGRYVRPDQVNVQARLTPYIAEGDWNLSLNMSAEELGARNVRVSLYPAVDGVEPPDTEDGWCFYRGLEACWQADIAKVDGCQEIVINADGSCCIRCVDGSVIDADQYIDKTASRIDCGGRFWLVVEVCCKTETDLRVEAFLHRVEAI